MPSQSNVCSARRVISGQVVAQELRRVNDDGTTSATRAVLLQPAELTKVSHSRRSDSRPPTSYRAPSEYASGTHRSRRSSVSSSRTVVPSGMQSNFLPSSVSGGGQQLSSDWSAPKLTGSRALTRIPEEGTTTGSYRQSQTRRASQDNMALVPFSRGSELRRSGTVAGSRTARPSEQALTRAPSASRRDLMPSRPHRAIRIEGAGSASEIDVKITPSHISVRVKY